MANKTIYPHGVAEVTVPATESIAISNFGGGIAKIYYLIEEPNYPPVYQFQQTLENSSVTLGAFTNETIVKIEANGSKVIYDVATAPDTGIGDADTLNGQAGSYYRNATNINAGTLDDDRLPSSIAKEIKIVPTTIGGVAADTNEDDLVLEDTNSGMTITSSTTGNGTIAFGDSDAKRRCRIYYNHTNDYLTIEVNGVPLQKILLGVAGYPVIRQEAPTAYTTDATITTASLLKSMITVNNGAAGTTNLTLPLAADMDTAFPGIENQNAYEFVVINISTVAGEDCTIATNTGWTLVGNMVIEADDDDRANSSARFRARRTAANTWTLYRVA